MNKLIICIATNNRPNQILKTLDNLDGQTCQDFTAIILNDGSNSETKKIILERFFNFNFEYLESTEKSGLPNARNKILDFIKRKKIYDNNTYVAFIDDDLIIKNDFVEKIKFYSEKYDGFCFRMKQNGESTTFDFTKNVILQKILRPIIGRIIPSIGIIFGGFYIEREKEKKIDHINGGCLIYNFSKNRAALFDLNLNEGNFVMEDTCFTYELAKKGNQFRYIGNYEYTHNPPTSEGCKIENKKEKFFWYWKHKFYIIKKFHGKITFYSAVFFCFWECIILSVIFKINLLKEFYKSLKINEQR